MRKILGIFIASLFLLASCEKSVDLTPTSVITANSFWKSADDARGAMIGLHGRFRNTTNEHLFVMGEMRSEIMTSATSGTVGFDKYYNHTLTIANPGPSWLTFYETINQANLILKYVPEISFPVEADKNRILAQAHTMRAFLYFCMVKTWGGVPIRTEPTESYDPATIQIARSSVEDVFTLIKTDLDKALQLYPDNNFPTGRSLWSKPAANVLKGDVYLWTGKVLNGGTSDFTTALAALNDAKTANAGLLPNYSDIFAYTNKGNHEVLFAVNYDVIESAHNYFMYMYINDGGLAVSPETRTVIGTVGSGNTGNSIMQISKTVRDQFLPEDQRRLGTFYEIYNTSNVFVSSITMKGRGVVDNGTRHFKNDVIIYRYAELLLLIAEAKNALDQDPSNELNEVRKRAYGEDYVNHVFVNGSKAANDEAILKERLLELATEGKRWWDLIRFDQVFEKVPALQGRSAEKHLLLFPIGNSLRSLEPLVDENPGWN